MAASEDAQPRFTIAAYAVVENYEGQALLTRPRENHEWVLPGGSVESAEAPWEAVVREVAEETGLHVELRRLRCLRQASRARPCLRVRRRC